jgi:CheY-like chemotaxis protein
MLVLLVEDHEDTREMTILYMGTKGIRVETAVTGLQAIMKAQELQPHVIVMDLGLPGMDGWEATRHLKSDPRTKRIPIVALSGHALRSDESRAREAGCDVYLRKPCTPDDLIQAVLSVVPPETDATA